MLYGECVHLKITEICGGYMLTGVSKNRQVWSLNPTGADLCSSA